MKRSEVLAKKLEIIFVSSDKGPEQFKEYFDTMPWKALPFQDRDRKEKLSDKFGVQGIPTLVLLGPDGKVLNLNGRSAIIQDPTGANFPWRTPGLWEIVNGKVQDNSDTSHAISELRSKNKYIAFYFSASWCPPCRNFTPILIELYKKLKESNSGFEIFFVSQDRTPEAHADYFKKMPWYSFKFGEPIQETLYERFDVEGIPTLVVVEADTGIVVTEEGVGAVKSDPQGANFPWLPKKVEELDQATFSRLNKSPCVLAVYSEEKPLIEKSLNEVLIPFVEKYTPKDEEDDAAEVCQEKFSVASCLWASKSSEPLNRILPLFSSAQEVANGAIFILNKGEVFSPVAPITSAQFSAETLEAFVADYLAKKTPSKSLQ